MTDEYWDLTAHVRGALAEALVAEAIYRRHADVVLHAPRHPGYDVSSEAGGLRVDAKVSVLVEADLDGNGTEPAAEWDAGTRPDVLPESATHLGLVVLDDSLTALRLFEGGEAVLSGEVVAHGRVFLVPGDVARAEAQPVWSTRHGRPSAGRFRYLGLSVIEPFEVDFQPGSSPAGMK